MPKPVLFIAVIKVDFSAFYRRETAKYKQLAVLIEHGRKAYFAYIFHSLKRQRLVRVAHERHRFLAFVKHYRKGPICRIKAHGIDAV